MDIVDEPTLKVARIVTSQRETERAVLSMHHLVGTPGSVEHYVEEHVTTLFTRDEYETALRRAGFDVEFDPEGLIGRGMYFGSRRP